MWVNDTGPKEAQENILAAKGSGKLGSREGEK